MLIRRKHTVRQRGWISPRTDNLVDFNDARRKSETGYDAEDKTSHHTAMGGHTTDQNEPSCMPQIERVSRTIVVMCATPVVFKMCSMYGAGTPYSVTVHLICVVQHRHDRRDRVYNTSTPKEVRSL